MNETYKRKRWNRKLINDHKGQWLLFDNLPQEAQNAAIIYQFGARAKWGEIDPADIKEARQELKERTRGKRWGIASIPIEQIKNFVLQFDKDIAEDWKDFDSYHKWYISYGNIPEHKGKQWPIILSGFGYEFIQDGWHRLHCYMRQGKKTVPILLFP